MRILFKFIIVVLSIFNLNCKSGEVNQNNVDDYKLRQERNVNYHLEFIHSVSLNLGLHQDIKLLKNNKIIMDNYNDKTLEIYPENDSTFKRLGKFGNGPCEVTSISDFYIFDSLRLIIDHSKQSISLCNETFGEKLNFKLNESMDHGFVFEDTSCIISLVNNTDLRLVKYQINSISSKFIINKSWQYDFSSITNHSENAFWKFTGKIFKGSSGYLYACNFYDLMFYFSNDGNIVWKNNFVYTVPSIEIETVGNRTFPIKNETSHMIDGYYDSEKLYVLCAIVKKKQYIDVYTEKDGSYLYSIELPIVIKLDKDYPKQIAVKQNIMYILYESTLKKYRISKFY